MSSESTGISDSIKEIGDALKHYAHSQGIQLYPLVMEKSISPLVGQGMVPCAYGGGAACVCQGGDGSSHHVAGWGHPYPHISELGGRPESSQKFPYKSKVEEYLATGKAPSVESLEMPRVEIVLTRSDKVSPLGTEFVTDWSQLQVPGSRGPRQYQHGQPVKVSIAGSPFLGIFWGVNTHGAFFCNLQGHGTVQVNPSHLAPTEPVGPEFGPWLGLPANAVMKAPKEFVAVMEKSLTDSPYVPASGYSFKHEDYVKAFLDRGWFTFVVGGAVRDALVGVVSKDIDIVTDAPFKSVESIAMHEVGGLCSNHFAYGALIQMGSDKHRALDIVCLRAGNVWFTESQIISGSIRRDTIYRDFSCNALYYDPYNRILIDPTGRGVQDSASKLLYPSCPSGEEEEWLNNPRLGLRFFKMLYKGYKPTPEILRLLTPARIEEECKVEAGHRGSAYLSKTGHWLLYRQICGDLFYGTGSSYADAAPSVRKQYQSRVSRLKTAILENGYESVWRKFVQPMLAKHVEV